MKIILTVLVIYVVYKYFLGGPNLIKEPHNPAKSKKQHKNDEEFIDYIEVDEDN